MSAKPRVVLHIGMHKTGTTSIQWFCVVNRLFLRLSGIDYPKAHDATGRRLMAHNDLFHAISHEKDFDRPHPVLGPSADRVKRLAAGLRPGRVTVLSAEGLSGESAAFAKALTPLRDHAEVRVVCFLRRQDDWVQSFYKQMVRSRTAREFRDFVGFLELEGTQRHLDYLQLLTWWADAFGERSLRIVIFPPAAGVVPAFLEAAGLPMALRHLPFGRINLNRSLSSGYIERIREANAAQALLPARSRRDRDVPYFTLEARRAFMARFDADNEIIRQRFRPDLVRLFNAID